MCSGLFSSSASRKNAASGSSSTTPAPPPPRPIQLTTITASSSRTPPPDPSPSRPRNLSHHHRRRATAPPIATPDTTFSFSPDSYTTHANIHARIAENSALGRWTTISSPFTITSPAASYVRQTPLLPAMRWGPEGSGGEKMRWANVVNRRWSETPRPYGGEVRNYEVGEEFWRTR
ncbi:hypothetical protein K432DRAFT_379794, partial [Lepidopterella palustris CBS 459.81]